MKYIYDVPASLSVPPPVERAGAPPFLSELSTTCLLYK